MKLNKKFIYVIIGLLVIYALNVYQAVKSLTLTLGKITNFSGKNFQLSWTQELNIINPSGVGVPIRSANLGAYIGNTRVGVAYLNGSQTAKRGSTPISFTVRIGWMEILALGQTIVEQARSGGLIIGYRGTVRSLGFNWPVKEQIQLPFKINM